MSTPINTLPLKTQQTNVDANDINDPIVQDVLNEFQEELLSSKQGNKSPMQMPSQQQQQMQLLQQQQQQMQQQQHMQQMQLLQQQQGLSPNNSKNNLNKYDNNMSSYLDIEIAKKSLILVIISLIIYNSGIINTMYEKMPEYLQDNLNNFDIYIKSASLFSIIYVLSFFEYI